SGLCPRHSYRRPRRAARRGDRYRAGPPAPDNSRAPTACTCPAAFESPDSRALRRPVYGRPQVTGPQVAAEDGTPGEAEARAPVVVTAHHVPPLRFRCWPFVWPAAVSPV